MFHALAVIAASLVAAPCRNTGALKVSLEPDRVSARDTIMSVRLCLTTPGQGVRIASMSGRITIDTSFASIVGVARAPGTPFLANADSAGHVLVAGAARELRGGTVATLELRLTHAGILPRVDVTLTELNESGGQSRVTRALVTGLEPRCVGPQPAVFEVLPPAASADPGEPLDLRINGCGFHATRNTIRFGAITVPNVRSTNDGTRIRVVVPKEYRPANEVPPMQIGAGVYDVSVHNGRGVSNARRVTLR